MIIVAAPSLEADVAALDLAAPGGRINWFAGLPKTDSTAADRHERRPLQGASRDRHDRVLDGGLPASAAELVNSGRLDVLPLVTRTRPTSEAPAEFVTAKDHSSLKTVLII